MGVKWLSLLVAGLLLIAACGDSEDPASPPNDIPPSTTTLPAAPTTTTPTSTTAPPLEGPVVDWADPAQTAAFDGGWVIAACQGDAPLLCVERGGATVGVVEALAFPLDSFTDVDQAADDAAKLDQLATGFLATFEEDRATGCGADYRFEPIAPRPFGLAGTPGLAYGFSGTLPTGEPSELNLQYSTIVDERVLAIVAIAYDEGGCPGRDDLSSWDSATLTEFRPNLEAVLRVTPLPAIP